MILCSHTLVLVDERRTSQPVLSWRHSLAHNNSPVHLTNLHLPVGDGCHLAACANSSNDGFVYQFSTRAATLPVSFEFTRQLDDFAYLTRECTTLNAAKNYNKRFDRVVYDRLVKQPVVGFSHLMLPQNDSFMLFRVIMMIYFRVRV